MSHEKKNLRLVGRRAEVKRSTIRGTNMLGLFSRIHSSRQNGEAGEIITRFDFEEEAIDAKALELDSRYSLEMDDGRVFYMKSGTRDIKKLGVYSNEARGRTKPNCYVTARYYKGRPTAQLRVLTSIRIGTEVLWDYGDRFDGD